MTFPSDAKAKAYGAGVDLHMLKSPSKAGRKAEDLTGKPIKTIVDKVRESHRRDRRMIFAAMRSCPYFHDSKSDAKKALVRAILVFSNERFRAYLLDEYSISKETCEGAYCVGDDNFVRVDMNMSDGNDVGCAWPLPKDGEDEEEDEEKEAESTDSSNADDAAGESNNATEDANVTDIEENSKGENLTIENSHESMPDVEADGNQEKLASENANSNMAHVEELEYSENDMDVKNLLEEASAHALNLALTLRDLVTAWKLRVRRA